MQKLTWLKYYVIIVLLITGMKSSYLFAMPWSLDMYDQKHIKPQEAIQNYPGQTVSQNTPDRSLRIKKIAKKLINSRSANKESIRQGKKMYQIICIVCHGHNGMGKTRVSKKFKGRSIEPFDLESLTDGQIYTQVRFGRFPMPSYAANLTPDEIWDIVNYLRTLDVPIKAEEEEEDEEDSSGQ